MHLTLALQLFKLPKGHIFRGKYRIVKRVSKNAVETLKKDYETEEANMFYLRHPYLTKEQSKGHAAVLQKQKKCVNKYIAAANEKFSKHRTLQNELSHMKVSESWEFTAGSQI